MELPSPIDYAPRRGSTAAQLANDPATRAIRTRRANLNGWTVAGTLWRATLVAGAVLLLELDLAADRIERLRDGGADALDPQQLANLACLAWVLPAGLLYVLVPLRRTARSRSVAVPPTRTFRTHPGPFAYLVGTWWVPLLLAVGVESRSNNTGPDGALLVDAALIALVPLALYVARRGTRIVLDERELRVRVPTAFASDGGIPEATVVPINWSDRTFGLIAPLVGFAVFAGTFTVAGTWGTAVLAVVTAIVILVVNAPRVDVTVPYSQARLIAVDAGTRPVLQLSGERSVDLHPFLRATSSNERLLWSIAERTQATRADDELDGVADEQLRDLVRGAVEGARTTPSPAAAIDERPVALVRGSFNGGVLGLVIGTVLVIVLAWSALQGNGEAAIVVGAVLAVLAGVALYAWIRSRRMALRADGQRVVVRGLRRSRTFPVDGLGALVIVPVLVPGGPDQPDRLVIDGVLVDRQGAFVERLRGSVWNAEQLAALAAATGLPSSVVQVPVPARTMTLAFPGYSPGWERDPGVVAIATVVVLVVVAVAWVGLTEGFEGIDDTNSAPSPEYTAAQRERRAVRDETEAIITDVLPGSEGSGGTPTGCVTEASGRASVAGCPVSPAIAAFVSEVGAGDAGATMEALCRCDPSRFGSASLRGALDPTAEPGSYAELTPPADAPRIVAQVTVIGDDVTEVEFDLDLDAATGERTITDVRCMLEGRDARGLAAIAVAGEGDATVEALRCEPRPEDD